MPRQAWSRATATDTQRTQLYTVETATLALKRAEDRLRDAVARAALVGVPMTELARIVGVGRATLFRRRAGPR